MYSDLVKRKTQKSQRTACRNRVPQKTTHKRSIKLYFTEKNRLKSVLWVHQEKKRQQNVTALRIAERTMTRQP